MSYIKATAEVVMLDVQDVVRTSFDPKVVSDLYDSLSGGAKRTLGAGFFNRDGVAAGLTNLLNDLDPEIAQALFDGLSDPDTERAAAVAADIAAYAERLRCSDASHRDFYRYSADEEDDSFDSEW